MRVQIGNGSGKIVKLGLQVLIVLGLRVIDRLFRLVDLPPDLFTLLLLVAHARNHVIGGLVDAIRERVHQRRRGAHLKDHGFNGKLAVVGKAALHGGKLIGDVGIIARLAAQIRGCQVQRRCGVCRGGVGRIEGRVNGSLNRTERRRAGFHRLRQCGSCRVHGRDDALTRAFHLLDLRRHLRSGFLRLGKQIGRAADQIAR